MKEYKVPVAGLVPAIHGLLLLGGNGLQDMDARTKSGQGVRGREQERPRASPCLR